MQDYLSSSVGTLYVLTLVVFEGRI